ncbi:MAG: hypothetical protein JSR82_08570 [Verrucomicrobia bacterium]|nr:hypothetical protein [Verrucomicrobiota bacterium]
MGLFSDPPPPEDDEHPPPSRAWFYLLLLALVGAVGWAGFRILLPVVRQAHSNRAATEAQQLLAEGDLERAARRAQDALELRLFNPEAWRALARVHTSAGNGAVALAWWKKLAEARPLTAEDRRERATAALLAGDFDFAAAEIQLLRQTEPSAALVLLLARLSEARGDSIQSLYYLGRVLTDPQAAPADRVGAARLALQARRRDEPLLRAARSALEDLALEPAHPQSLPAMRLLAEYLLGNHGAPAAEAAPRLAKARLAELFRQHPQAGILEELAAWDLQLAETAGGAAGRDAIHAEVVSRARTKGDLTTLHRTADWLLARGDLGRAFGLATAELAARSAPLAIVRIEALGRLGRWRDVIELLDRGTTPLEDWYKEMRAAQAYSMAGEALAGQQRWLRAIRAAEPDQAKLLEVARFAAAIGSSRASADAARALLKLAPGHRLAHELILAAAERMAGTEAVLEHLRIVRGFWPEDADLEIRELYLALLLGEGPAGTVERAATLLRLRPENPDRRAVLALALHRAGRSAAALETTNERAFLREAESTALLVVRSAALRAAGFREEADRAAQRVPRAGLRVEEARLLQ